MNIGVIGTGDIGAVIVKKLRDAGYPVTMANSKGPDSLRELAAKTGAIPVSVEEVVQDVDILFLVHWRFRNVVGCGKTRQNDRFCAEGSRQRNVETRNRQDISA